MAWCLALICGGLMAAAGQPTTANGTLTNQNGAGSDYLIDVWTTEDGLPNSSVTGIVQTPDGYLWIGTYNGLARFDGVRFVTFDPENTPQLMHARIRKLYLDAQGTLWINTYDGSLTSCRGGVFRLEWRSREYADLEILQVVSKPDHVTFLLPTGDLIRRDFSRTNAWQILEPPAKGLGTAACEDAAGTLWYRGRDAQLWRLRGGTFEPPPVESGLEGRRIRCVTADDAGRIWVGTDRGVVVWEQNRFVDQTPTNGTTPADITFVYQTQHDGTWLVADQHLQNSRQRQWQPGFRPWGEALDGAAVQRLGVHEERDGSMWFRQYGLGLVRVETNRVTRRFTPDEGFPGDRVDCFCEDSEGDFWAGVNRGGLVRLRKKRFQSFSVAEGAQPAAMVSVCEDAGGAMWFGTQGSGLARWRNGQLDLFDVPGGRGHGFVFSVYPGLGDRLWLSVGDEDLFTFTGGQLQRCLPVNHGVKVILTSRDGQMVWTGRKDGLFVCTNLETHLFSPYPGVPRSVDIRALAEGKDGVLWAGGGDGNLYRIRNTNVVMLNPGASAGRHPVWSLQVDPDGTVWAGTFRGGLLRYADGKFRRFTVKDGLPDNVIAQLLSDDKGNLWAGSHQGIFRVARAALNNYARGELPAIPCTAYGRYDGLPALECSGSYQPACWRTQGGRLWFTTLKGAVSIQPDDVAPNLRPPPVAIEELLIDGVEQNLRGMTVELPSAGERSSHAVAPERVLDVPPGKRQFEFHYTGLSFVSPDKVRFRYRLEGLEKDWVEAGPRRFVQYSFLRPGEYTFHVTACNNEGVWNKGGAILRLHVEPQFYETWWFAVTLAGLAGSLAVLTVRWTFRRRLRAEMERVERQRAVERDRARIAKDIHDDLGAGLTQITLLSELARRDTPEEVEAHVGQISSTARELTRAMDEIVWAINPQNDTLEGLITYISKFAQQYLTLAGIRCRLDVPTQLPNCVLGAETRHNLYLAIKETLNNIVKHSGATVATLRLECQPRMIRITIEDDGRGINAPTAAAGRSERASSGHGLRNIVRRLEDIGGRCDVSSTAGQGTRVVFALPVVTDESPVLATGPGSG
ncbi:MAG TPA: two-component regulator propeller domain-containing protein [Verrucomicrobiae bacterium]|nr:two-component regulator propeller domain-containing protein [Verrucomicrobiae bacterium]